MEDFDITILQNRFFVAPYYYGYFVDGSNNSFFLHLLFLIFTKRHFITVNVNNHDEMYMWSKGSNASTTIFYFFVTKRGLSLYFIPTHISLIKSVLFVYFFLSQNN